MTRDDLKSSILARHFDAPQRHQLASMAIDSIYAGIDELSKLGHRFQLVETDGPAPVEYPKMLYHSQFPGGMEVNSKDQERDYIGKGWSLTQQPTEGDFGHAGERSSSTVTPNPPTQRPTHLPDPSIHSDEVSADPAKFNVSTEAPTSSEPVIEGSDPVIVPESTN